MTESPGPTPEGGRPLDAHVRRVLDAAEVPVATLDAEGRLVSANPAFARVCGRAAGELLGLHVLALCPGQDQAAMTSTIVHLIGRVADVERGELRVVGADGRVRVLGLTLGALPAEDGRIDRILAIAEDLTEDRRRARRRRADALAATHDAVHDRETGLPNERGLTLLLASAVRRSTQTGAPFGLLRCDVTNLDEIEHTHGPAVARDALALLADRLGQRLRPADSVTRTGTGTFAITAEDLHDPQDAAGVAYRLLAAVVEPIRTGDAAVDVAITIGIAIGDGAASPHALLADASQAATLARQDGDGSFRLLDTRAPTPA